MPSQLAHMLLAEEACGLAFGSPSAFRDAPAHPFLVLGAQGPDIFYHNRRRKPSGLHFGALIHRKGYGRLTAAMVEYGKAFDAAPDDPIVGSRLARAALAGRGTLVEVPALGRVNAIACPDGIPPDPETCAQAADPRGFGLAVGAD